MRAYLRLFYSFGIGLSMLVGGCALNPEYANINYPYDSPKVNHRLDNEQLANKIQKLIDDQYGKEAKVKVLADHYNVLMLGQVNSQATKERIDNLVQNQYAVRNYWDYTNISNPPKLIYQASVTKQANLRLQMEYNINLENLQAVAVAGTVYILGVIKADQKTDLDDAITGIYTIYGVDKVVNLTKSVEYADNYGGAQ